MGSHLVIENKCHFSLAPGGEGLIVPGPTETAVSGESGFSYGLSSESSGAHVETEQSGPVPP